MKKMLLKMLGIAKRDRVILSMTEYIAKQDKEIRRLKSQIVMLANK